MKDSLSKYHYYRLTESERRLYTSLQAQLMQKKKTITIPYAVSVGKIINAVRDDSAELYFVKWQGIFSRIRFNYTAGTVTLRGSYLYTPQEIERLDKGLAQVVKRFQKYKTDRDKSLAVHDWLANNVIYDTNESDCNVFKFRNHNAVGALLAQKAVCEGYARAYQLVLNRLGVDCMMVIGRTYADSRYENSLHAWNIVKIDGRNYHVDVTWDAASYIGGKRHAKYAYYCLPRQMMSRDHECKLPIPCESWKENLFYRSGRIITTEQDFFRFFRGARVDGKGSLVMIKGMSKERLMRYITELCNRRGEQCQYQELRMDVWYIHFF